MKELRTEIEIKAAPEKVCQVLASLDKYPEWNPLIHQAIGTLKEGEKVDIKVRTETQDMTLHCVVVKVVPNKEFSWKYHVVHLYYSEANIASSLSQWEMILSVLLTGRYSMLACPASSQGY